ncbi:MAG: hypothetical protein UU40_C0005G0039 [Candidatus Uhrbacteria bacterium GW2011_GWD2_41_121]|uniref:Uncharacterized protein n=1 Tax=Candidatus Uhrbacteria bacterium GW2011_GWC1_41_20 TaxID=1618983 RepID=A0A0G0YGP4_9BACT|nr:MAG: hypothetical protein UT52_C0007G0039 [Candidatus Uhrbacteria bacterium GW2011_GWE1_39_46]KKR64175.1 MAG: hypothetical protein UU04_C0005G0039 [Candidatus Uhrbacteria bacterium GW2011_GWC2_40_450]KKR90310.1 MAG: hypothetical protein UU40_C0005G0039 [Candidatus Uhrbacteria bacterium GW2011_GWD2_41_121]KKR95990.1 MAG: hypothetical protein UU46_C0010G0025 [Candidatus Uhrbacteria bacterium GW2011_GWD1_41_16]KKR99532.1 MAG: hypothetical protein UU50_C0005G0039 [Candidatus Uhrbacteria bacteriu
MNNLSISFESEHKTRHLRSNAKEYLFLLLIIILGCACFRLWIARDSVSSIKPDDSVISVQFLKTPANIELLHNNLGFSLLIPNSGITWDDVILMSNREFAVHINAIGQINGITIDTNISDAQKLSIEQFGLFIKNINDRTLISQQETAFPLSSTRIFTLMPLWPFFDGHIESPEKSGWLEINKDGLVFHDFGVKPTINSSQMLFPDNSVAVARVLSTQESLNTNTLLSNLLTSPIKSILEITRSDSPWAISLYSYESENLDYSILIKNKLATEDLALLAKQLIQSGDLSTVALTLDDSTHVSELVSTYQNPEVSITTEQGSTFIHAYTDKNEIHLTQTPTDLYITSIDSSLISAQKNAQPACNSKAHTFADLSQIKLNPSMGFDNLLIDQFQSFGITNRNIYFCW